ncbi:MAG: FtsX-like permease family protein [Bacilli bacterium]
MKLTVHRLLSLIKNNLMIFISLILISMPGMILMTALNGSINSLNQSLIDYQDESVYPDLTVTVDVDPSILEATILSYEQVDKVNFRSVYDASFKYESNLFSSRVFSYPEEGFQQFHVYEECEKLTTFPSVEIEYNFAKANNIVIGDIMKVNNGSTWRNCEITKFVSSYECLYMKRDAYSWGKTSDFGYIYFSENDFYRLFSPTYYQILILTKGHVDPSPMFDELASESVAKHIVSYYTKENSPVNSSTRINLEPLKSVSYIIPPIFLAVTLLFIYLFFSRVIRKQRKEIGIYLALGYSNWQISLLFLSFIGIIMLIASVLGTVLGYELLKLVCKLYATSFHLLSYQVIFSWPIALFSVGITLLVGILSSLITTFCLLKKDPSENLSLCPLGSSKPSLPVRTIFKKLPSLFKMNIASFFRHKGRNIVTIICLSFSFILILTSLSFSLSKNYLMENNYGFRMNYDVQTVFNDTSTEEILTEVENYPECQKAEPMVYSSLKLEFQSQSSDIILCGLNPDTEMIGIEDEKEVRLHPSENGLTLEYHLCQQLGIKKGDYVTLNDEEYPVIDISFQNMNRIQYSGLNLAKQILQKETNCLLINVLNEDKVSLVNKLSALKGYYSSTFTSLLMEANKEDFEVLDIGVGIIIIFAALITILIVYNVSLMLLDDKHYDYAVMLSLGYNYKDIFFSLLGNSLSQLLLASLIGILSGNSIAYLVLKEISTKSRNYPLRNGIGLCFIVFAIMLVMTLITQLISIIKVRRIRLLDVIKDQN